MATEKKSLFKQPNGRIGAETVQYVAGSPSNRQSGQQTQQSQVAQRMNSYVTQAQQKQAQAQTQGTSGGSASTYDPYLAQANALYEQLMNRGAFKWDMQGDDLYRQYEDMYTNAGNLAMKDAMGTAAGLTGGYGNSYAALVGNQANQAYMTQLAAMIPDLEERAYQRWLNQGDELMTQYELALSRAGSGGGGGSGSGSGSYTTAVAGESGYMLPNLIKTYDGYSSADMNKAITTIAANGGLNWSTAAAQEPVSFDYFNDYWKYLNQ